MTALPLALATTIAAENQRPGAPDWEIASRHCITRSKATPRTTTGAASRCTASTAPMRPPGRCRSIGRTPRTRTASASTAPAIPAPLRVQRRPLPGARGVRPQLHHRPRHARAPIADAAPLRHHVFLWVGHDEYWSSPVREHVEAARDRGVHLAFLGADACFRQIRFESNERGDTDRTIVGYKEAAGALDLA